MHSALTDRTRRSRLMACVLTASVVACVPRLEPYAPGSGPEAGDEWTSGAPDNSGTSAGHESSDSASSSSSSGSASALTTGSGGSVCDELFDDGEFSCVEESVGGCDYLLDHPAVTADWWVSFERDLGHGGDTPHDDISDFTLKAECVAAYLDEASIAHGPIDDSVSFAVEATRAQLDALCRARMIAGCEPSWPLDRCYPLMESACLETPLCASQIGTKLDETETCTRDMHAACVSASDGCASISVVMTGPADTCWLMYADCFGDQVPEWAWQEGDGVCPNYEVFEQLPACQ